MMKRKDIGILLSQEASGDLAVSAFVLLAVWAHRGGWKEAKAGSAAGFAVQGLSPLEMLCCHPSDQWLPSAPPNQVKTKP